MHKLTRNYQLVLQTIRGSRAPQHLTAAEIHARLHRRHQRLGFATVHRALTRLVEMDLVLRLHVPDHESAVYEAAAPPHAHFTCRACGAVADVAYTVPATARDAVGTELGVVVDDDVVIHFRGLCAACTPVAATG